MPSDGSRDTNRPRASRSVKLVLMGVAGAALLYSCAPAVGALGGLSALPLLWGMSNPFYRGPANCGPGVPGNPQCAPGSTSSSGGGSSFRSGGSSSTASSTTTGSGQSMGSTASQSTSERGGFGSTASSHSSGSSSS